MPTNPVRRARILSLADFAAGTGLEIGPLDSPIVLRPDFDVRYADIKDTAGLREQYRDDPGVSQPDIAHVDYALTDAAGQIRSLSAAASAGGPYDWVLASHVVEHVPDLIGWLSEIADLMADFGSLVLAIPDRRYTFDVLRPQTTVGQILESYFNQDHKPSVRAVYDFYRDAVKVDAAALWGGFEPKASPRHHALPKVIEQTVRARDSSDYIDSHCWMFTPGSFVSQIVELGQLELCDFIIEHVIDTRPNELEFYVTLRRIPRGLEEVTLAEMRLIGVQEFTDHSNAAITKA